MKTKLLISLVIGLMTLVCNAQKADSWEKMHWLLGGWQGEGFGQPGLGGGIFSFSFDLDKNIIVRKSHSEYNSDDKKSVVMHDDLMIIYKEPDGTGIKADYFDNEGHVIKYSVLQSDKAIVFLSEKQPDAPAFRLIYKLLDTITVNVKFEISGDGKNFNTYIEGNSKKII